MIYKAIIADDEEMARVRLRRLLAENFDEFDVVAEAKDGIAARSMIEKYRPDVVFMDIDMPGQSGIETARDACRNTFVIFVTAYNQYALEAFKALSVDYILKPVEVDDLRHAIDKLKKLHKPREIDTIIGEVTRRMLSPEKMRHIKVSVGETIKFISCEDVVCLEADQKYTTLYTIDSNRYLSDQTIREFEQLLPKPDFIRIHRKHILNSKFIKELKRMDDRKFKAILKIPFDRELIVGRHFLAGVLAME